jgi:hypothetical protein
MPLPRVISLPHPLKGVIALSKYYSECTVNVKIHFLFYFKAKRNLEFAMFIRCKISCREGVGENTAGEMKVDFQ